MLRPTFITASAIVVLGAHAARATCQDARADIPAQTTTAPAPDAPRDTRLDTYSPESLAGFTVLVHRDMNADERRLRRVRAALLFDLESLSAKVPAPALHALRSVRILVTPSLPPCRGFGGRGMCYHADASWLESAGFERERAGTVEICNADDFLQWRAEQPMMVLHELAHAYHAMLGFDRADVRDAFGAAEKLGRYAQVRHALRSPDERERAYALTSEREYFAELTEARFGRNDFEPFTRDELAAFDPAGLAVIEKLWSLDAASIDREREVASPPAPRTRRPESPATVRPRTSDR